MVGVCTYALQMQRDHEMNAIEGKSHGEAIVALANAYRAFAKELRELCKRILYKT